jgi:hypothetical protein
VLIDNGRRATEGAACPRKPPRTGAVAIVVLLVSLLATGCVSHPVGPARTFASYEAKARTTAESARSAVATVRLLADASKRSRVFGPYASISVSEQEDALRGVEGTFASIQPPDSSSDALRDDLETLLTTAIEHVTAVRIDVRRGDLDGAGTHVEDLEADEVALTSFLQAHGAKD